MHRLRVGAVSFLNTKPLLYGLGDEIELYLDIPSRLLSGLTSGDFDVALLPVADVPQVPGAQILSAAGGIGSDGETLTVRIFSDRPIRAIETLLCDTDSHTSVQLARVVLRERFGIEPTFKPLPRSLTSTAPCLLIGDKVISAAPGDLPIQIDLGAEWNALTGLPFVFAVWTARHGVDTSWITPRLAAAREAGLAQVDELVAQHAAARGWPPTLLRRYYTEYLRYEVGPREREAMSLFWQKAGLRFD